MTDAELKLWSRLRGKQICGVQFYRQKPIGPYIVDFYAPAAKLVVEADGSQHLTAPGLSNDAVRDGYLRERGLHVLHFDDRQVLREIDSVVTAIWQAIAEHGDKA